MFTQTLLLSALAALATAQSSVLSFTRVPNPVTDGQVQVLLYSTNDTTSPVTILLRKGLSSNLQTVYTVTENAQNGQYLWTPPTWIADDTDYALEIMQGTQVNYYGPFTIQGSQPAAVASHSSAAAASSSSLSSASHYNATHTMAAATGGAHNGTYGTYGHANSTMGYATMTGAHAHNQTTMTMTTHRGPAITAVKTTHAVLGATQTTAAASASSSGAASSHVSGSSTFALLFGGVAALFYL